jgi:hypothetical protein
MRLRRRLYRTVRWGRGEKLLYMVRLPSARKVEVNRRMRELDGLRPSIGDGRLDGIWHGIICEVRVLVSDCRVSLTDIFQKLWLFS